MKKLRWWMILGLVGLSFGISGQGCGLTAPDDNGTGDSNDDGDKPAYDYSGTWRGEFTIVDQITIHRAETCQAYGTTNDRRVVSRTAARGIAAFTGFTGSGEYVSMDSTQAAGRIEASSEETRHDTGCGNLDTHSLLTQSRTIDSDVTVDWGVAYGTPNPDDNVASFPVDARVIVGSDQTDQGQSNYVYDGTVSDSCPPIEDTTNSHDEQTGDAKNLGAGPCGGCGLPAHGTFNRASGVLEASFEGVEEDLSGTVDCSSDSCSCTETTEFRRTYRIRLIYVTAGGDSDGDGVLDADDNCPFDWNPDQKSTSGGMGDVCAALPWT